MFKLNTLIVSCCVLTVKQVLTGDVRQADLQIVQCQGIYYCLYIMCIILLAFRSSYEIYLK